MLLKAATMQWIFWQNRLEIRAAFYRIFHQRLNNQFTCQTVFCTHKAAPAYIISGKIIYFKTNLYMALAIAQAAFVGFCLLV